jgi:nitroreductase
MISAGCAIQNILLTAHSLGFGAGLSSGKALYSNELKNLFNLKAQEEPLCFISIGTVTNHKTGRIRPTHSSYTTTS